MGLEDIQNAIDEANEGDTIELNGTFISTGKEIKVNKNITINGNQKTTLDANKSSGFISFTGQNKKFILNGLVFINSEGETVGIDDRSASSNYQIINCNFEDNSNSFGLIEISENVVCNIVDCNFINNNCSLTTSKSTDFKNCIFKNNDIGISNVKSFNNSNFTQNEKVSMGAIEEVNNCNFINQKQMQIGYVKIVSNSNFMNNIVYGNGVISQATLVINSSFENNEAKRAGSKYDMIYGFTGNSGAIHDVDSVENCIFKNNKAVAYGGAISEAKTIKNSIFENNQVLGGGGAIYNAENVINCNFTNNKAGYDGGAIYGVAVVKNSIFKNNYAKGGTQSLMGGGGAIYVRGKVTLDSCSFISNSVESSGSAIHICTIMESAEVLILNSKFTNNVANGKFEPSGYKFKNYANGAIYTLGNELAKITFKNCQGLDIKNTDKFKQQTQILAKVKNNLLTITVKDKIYLNPLKNLKISIKINGNTYNGITDKNGQFKFLIFNIIPKKYSVKITYAGTDERAKASKIMSVQVKKLTPKIISKKQTFKLKQKVKKIKVTLKIDKTPLKKQKLTLKIKGKLITSKTNSKGIAIFKLTKFTKKGTFKGKITFKATKFYKKVTGTVKIKIK